MAKIDRRLKLGLVCMADVISFSRETDDKYFDRCVKESMPKGTSLIAKQNDFERGSLKIILHNPEWEEVPRGGELEIVLVKPQEPSKIKLAYNH